MATEEDKKNDINAIFGSDDDSDNDDDDDIRFEPKKQAVSDKSDGSDSDDSDSNDSGSDDDTSGRPAKKRGRLQKGNRSKKASGSKEKTGQQPGSATKKGKRKLKRKADDSDDEDDNDSASALKRAKSTRTPKPTSSSDTPGDNVSGNADGEKPAKYQEGDEYDSGSDIEKTAADDQFIDNDGDDNDLLNEYAKDNDQFADERPDAEGGEEEEEEEEGHVIDQVMKSMKRGRRGELKLSAQQLEDTVQGFLARMDAAADQDAELSREGKPAVFKLQLLPTVESMVSKVQMQLPLLDYQLLRVVQKWIWPRSKTDLGSLTVRTRLLKLLLHLPVEKEHLKEKSCNLGGLVKMLLTHPQETTANKALLREIYQRWSRLVFRQSTDHRQSSASMAAQSQDATVAAAAASAAAAERRANQANRMRAGGSGDALKSRISGGVQGDGGAQHVHIPLEKAFDFKLRPVGHVDPTAARPVHPQAAPESKRGQLSKRMQNLSRPIQKNKRAVGLSIEGRGM